MSNNLRNSSGIFKLFAYEKPDKTGAILQKIGTTCFTTSFVAGIALQFMQHRLRPDSSILNVTVLLFGFGFIAGVLMFIATGIHYSGREKGKTTFLASSALILRNTFVYILLPVLAITTVIVIWAITTKQPAFR